MKQVIFLLSLLFMASTLLAQTITATQNFIFIGAGSYKLPQYKKILNDNHIAGVQVIYTWKSLEPEKGKYNFTTIQHDLEFLNSLHKKLFIQIQDRFFEPEAKYIPSYLLEEPEYKGGLAPQLDRPGATKPLVSGWVTKQWVPLVRLRYQKLLQALALKFDGKIYGINLPETAIDITQDNSGFSCDKYYHAEMENLKVAHNVFKRTYVLQYVNFFPCEWNNDHRYMSRLFQYAQNNHIGLGGPDVVPYKKSHMNNSYPFFYQYKGKLSLVAMAIQEPDYTYINPKTGKLFTHQEFSDFAIHYLGAHILFWSPRTTSSI